MRPESSNEGYLWDMRQAAPETMEYVEGINYETFAAANMMRRAVERNLEIIGEAARRIDVLFRELHPEIPWTAIVGQRNVLAHEYGTLDAERIWIVASELLETLVAQITAVPPPPPNAPE
jgi:uncharacterized protein with HEPN domain